MLCEEKSGVVDVTEHELANFRAALQAGHVFDYTDPESGMYVKVDYCKETNKVRIQKKMPDTTAILNANEEILAANKRDWKGDYHYVGRIPYLAQANYCQNRGITNRQFMSDPNEFKRMMNDSDNQVFRLKKGKL